jgi:hypothetical protein
VRSAGSRDCHMSTFVNSGSSPPCARRAVTCWRHQIGPLIQRGPLTRLL